MSMYRARPVYSLLKLREDAEFFVEGQQMTMVQIGDEYFRLCGHSRTEVDHWEIVEWYRDRGWYWKPTG